MRNKFVALILGTIVILAFAGLGITQPNSSVARRIFAVFSNPSICSENSVYYNMISHRMLVCRNNNSLGTVAFVGEGTGLSSLNGLLVSDQFLLTGTSGTDFNIVSSGTNHTFNIPTASATNRGLLSAANWTTFNSKQAALGFTPENVANKGATNGYASLSSGKVPLIQISEVLSVTNLTDYAGTSGSGTTAIKATITGLATNDCLKWSGTDWTNSASCGSGGGLSDPGTDGILVRNGLNNTLARNLAGASSKIAVTNGDGVAGNPTINIGTDVFDKTLSATLTNLSAPSTPASGFSTLWASSTDKVLKLIDDAGNTSVTIRPNTCTGTDKVSSITSAGVVVCTADQGGGGSGVLTINALTATDQTMVDVDDTNVTLNIGSVTSTHTFTIGWTGTLAAGRLNSNVVQAVTNDTNVTGSISAQNLTLGWTGTLAKARTLATTVYTDQANTFGQFNNKFQAGGWFQLLDPLDNTKIVNFELNNITAGTTRTVTIANAGSVTVIPDAGASNNFLTGITTGGVITKAQPAFSNISGNIADAQVPNNITIDSATTATTANSGDSATAFFPSGVLETAIGGTEVSSSGSAGNVLQSNGSVWTSSAVDFNELTGTATDAQIPNTITIDTATTATLGDSATAFFSSGIIEADRLGTSGGAGKFLRYDNVWVAIAGGGDALVANPLSQFASTTSLQFLGVISNETGSGLVVANDTPTLIGPIISNNATLPTAALGKLAVDTDDNKLYYASDGTTWGEVFVAGLSLVNLASNVTGTLPVANGGTGQTTAIAAFNSLDPLTTKGDVLTHNGTDSIRVAVGTNGLCLKANSAQSSGLEWGTCGSGTGDVVGPSSATDNAIVRFDSTTGKLVQNSVVTVADTTGDISSPGNISLGVGGSVAGNIEFTQGTAPSLGTTAVTLYAPTSVTSYAIVFPTAAASGIPHYSNSSNIITMTISAISLTADITGTLAVGNGGSGATTLTGILKGNGTSAFTSATAGTDYTSPSSTESFTNKTFDAEASGNLFTIPRKFYLDAAACLGTSAALNWDTPTSSAPTASCTGTTTTVGAADFVDASTTGFIRKVRLPATWVGTVDIVLEWFANSASSNSVRWQVSTGCVADSEAISTGPSYNTASASNTAYTGTANQRKSTTFTGVAITNCAAGETMFIKTERVGGDAGDSLAATAELLGAEVTIRVAE
jgi:trimeric autotransporter adhesin